MNNVYKGEIDRYKFCSGFGRFSSYVCRGSDFEHNYYLLTLTVVFISTGWAL